MWDADDELFYNFFFLFSIIQSEAPTPLTKTSSSKMTEEAELQSKTLAMRIQGKIASKMSTKGLAKQVVDGPTSDLIDNCYKIAKIRLSGNKKDAEKIMKNMIKIVVKVAILSRNNAFTDDEMVLVRQFQAKFSTIAKTIISFYEVDFTFDADYMVKIMTDSQDLLKRSVKNHLTEKSLNRIDNVYELYSNAELLEEAFTPDSKYRSYLGSIVTGLNTLLEQGELWDYTHTHSSLFIVRNAWTSRKK